MKYFIRLLAVLGVAAAGSAFAAQEPSIDRLLNKLPPPEKFVDAAVRDPLAREAAEAVKAHNYGTALDAARQLAARYPKSMGAQMMHGALALRLRQLPEASAA